MSKITRKLFTYEDCLRMGETGVLSPAERTELINGEIFVMPQPSPRHGAAVDGVTDAFHQLLRDKASIRTQGCVVLDKYAAPLPDIAVLRPRTDRYVTRNPDAKDIFLIVEFAMSSVDYDSSVKLQMYAITGVREYWVADLEDDTLFVHRDPVGDEYQTVLELHQGDFVSPHAFPDCKLPLDLLLPD
jgi:Uma2 family endonuclease